jgi:hypothetical protein
MPYADFLKDLDDYRFAVVDIAVRTFLARQGHNVCDTEWGKALRGGLYEFRIRRPLGTVCSLAGIDPPAGLDLESPVLLRVFFAVEGDRIVLLLGGYDKGSDSAKRRQDKEIRRARGVLAEHRLMQQEERKQARKGRRRS